MVHVNLATFRQACTQCISQFYYLLAQTRAQADWQLGVYVVWYDRHVTSQQDVYTVEFTGKVTRANELLTSEKVSTHGLLCSQPHKYTYESRVRDGRV